MKRYFLAAVVMLMAAPALAQQKPGMSNDPAMQRYMQADEQMHQRMQNAMGATSDETFARMMIEHHKGGIEMAQTVIDTGKDPEIKRQAQKTIEMQKKEVAELQSWLDKHGSTGSSSKTR